MYTEVFAGCRYFKSSFYSCLCLTFCLNEYKHFYEINVYATTLVVVVVVAYIVYFNIQSLKTSLMCM